MPAVSVITSDPSERTIHRKQLMDCLSTCNVPAEVRLRARRVGSCRRCGWRWRGGRARGWSVRLQPLGERERGAVASRPERVVKHRRFSRPAEQQLRPLASEHVNRRPTADLSRLVVSTLQRERPVGEVVSRSPSMPAADVALCVIFKSSILGLFPTVFQSMFDSFRPKVAPAPRFPGFMRCTSAW